MFSKENFFAEKVPFLSYGKLRVSYGTTGSDQIGDYQYLNLYGSVYTPVPYQGMVAGTYKAAQSGFTMGVDKEI